VREVAEPHAGPGEVRVRVSAAGLNPADWKLAESAEAAGRFGLTLPAGFGNDFAGVVDEVGDGVTGFAAGDRVYGGARGPRGRGLRRRAARRGPAAAHAGRRR
jgi:NADPH:quinone reductase-like Zn-dependent oxidoreductase